MSDKDSIPNINVDEKGHAILHPQHPGHKILDTLRDAGHAVIHPDHYPPGHPALIKPPHDPNRGQAIVHPKPEAE